ncbi:Actin-related protein [Gracilaria domingensis]|nr:Actin-related protein [Gracilaria domingensis]
MYQVEGTVPSIVVDAGSHTVKAGTAGEDLPHVLVPSALACEYESEPADEQPNQRKYKPARAGHNAVNIRKDNVEIVSPFGSDGLIENWNLFETLLSHTLCNELHAPTRENALLCAEPNHNGRKSRERIVELIFEKFEVPALYLARAAVLSAYANGKTTGLVLDIGHSGTSAVPVEDGAVLKGKAIRTAIGGRTLNAMLDSLLQGANPKLRPIWSYKRTITRVDGVDEDNLVRQSEIKELSFPKTTASFMEFSRIQLLEEVKANLCVVHENPSVDLKSLPVIHGTYELPDGNTIEMNAERFSVAEQTIFARLPHVIMETNTDARLSYVDQYLNGSRPDATSAKSDESHGLHGLVVDAIKKCPEAIHRDMYAGVCLTGGTSDMGGLYERLSFGLLETYHKVRVLAATGSHERKYCAWTGGSILATFSEFQKMWFSKSEYDENGSSFVHRKCQ